MNLVTGTRRPRRDARQASEIIRERARKATRSMTTDLQGGQIRPRLVAMYLFVTVLLLAMLLRTGYLQTIGSGQYREASLDQRTRVSIDRAERGSILDRQGLELALSVPTRTVFADPSAIVDPIATARALAGILQITPEEEITLAEKLQSKGSFVFISRQAPQEIADAVLALQLPGISSYREPSRAITLEGLRALVGRTDPDGVGIAGLEILFNDALTGVDGKSIREVNSKGQSIVSGVDQSTEAIAGSDLVTTIDRNIQFQVDTILTQQTTRLSAKSGTAIVMDSKTGEIYAISTMRRNEDGTYSADSGNFAAVEAYEPGSVAKVFSISAALNEGTVETNSIFNVPGAQTFFKDTEWEDTLKDAYPHRLEDMSVRKILVDSSNLGTIQVAQTMTPQKLHDYLRSFGFGTKTDINFPGESNGLLADAENWQGLEKVTTAYGYGYASSALQLIAGVNVVANDGNYVAPRIISGTIDKDGISHPAAASATRPVIKPETAAKMRLLMGDVVCFGTAKLARLNGITAAGKTGTGYKRQDNGTYLKDDGSRAYFASFVGFLPADQPRFTVLVSIDEPDPASQDRFGGTAAAPVFANIAQVLINELDIRPSATDAGCAAKRPAELGPSH